MFSLGVLCIGKHILVLVDDGVADDQHAIVGHALDQIAELVQAAVLPQRVEMLANMRFEDVEVAVDQLGRTERHLVGEMDAAAMGLDRVALQRDLAGDVAIRILIVLALDVDRRPDALDGAHRVGARR